LTFRRCGGFLRGVIDVMNEYREEFSLRRGRVGSKTFPMCTMKPTIHRVASAVHVFPEMYVRESYMAVLRSEIRKVKTAMLLYVLSYSIYV